MITNIRLDLTDDQRRAVASLLAGKPVRRLATRQEIVRFVEDTVALEMSARRHETEPRQIGDKIADAMAESISHTPDDFCSDDCCRRNDLLQSRVNVLQHRLDTR